MSNPEMGVYTPEQTESKAKYPKPKFMIVAGEATASHKMGDQNYREGELVIIDGEDSEHYYGRGHEGLRGNLVEQQFPKQNLRELNAKEIEDLGRKEFYVPQLGVSRYKLTATGEIEQVEPMSTKE